MSNFHTGVNCAFCGETSIVGTRYACLVCTDFNLCESCFSNKHFCLSHKAYHPVQEIFPDELTDSLMIVPSEEIRIYCCPYCNEKDFNGNELTQHCQRFHPDGGYEVRCPVCLIFDKSYSELLPISLLEHLLEWHGELNYDEFNEEPFQPPQPTAEEEAQLIDECTICMEDLQTGSAVRKLLCSHEFHSNCITDWLNNNSTCPVCRSDVTS